MLHEIKTVRQEKGSGSRRWFESEGLELVVWLNQEATITGFQLCYDVGRGEHALTWRSGDGFVHARIDAGDETPFANRAPVLQPDGPVPWSEISQLFRERADTLEPDLRRLVEARLAEGRAAGQRS